MLNGLLDRLSALIIGRGFGGWTTFSKVLQQAHERQIRHARLREPRFANERVKRPVKWIVTSNYQDFKFLRDFVKTWAPGVWEVSYLGSPEPIEDSQEDKRLAH